MQSCCRGRRHPRGCRTRFGVCNLCLHHGRHLVWHRPHAFSNLGASRQITGETNIDIPILIRLKPSGLFHLPLGDHGPCFHRRVNLITCPIEKTGINKNYPLGSRPNTFFEIDRGPAFLIHDANFDGVPY